MIWIHLTEFISVSLSLVIYCNNQRLKCYFYKNKLRLLNIIEGYMTNGKLESLYASWNNAAQNTPSGQYWSSERTMVREGRRFKTQPTPNLNTLLLVPSAGGANSNLDVHSLGDSNPEQFPATHCPRLVAPVCDKFKVPFHPDRLIKQANYRLSRGQQVVSM